jgi:hypothetical protein
LLVVWEPILVTDWSSPSGNTLARIPDRRARQFWDARHLVTQELSRIENGKSQPAPDCCVNKGNHWDEAILYAPGPKWSDGPTPVFWNGPVVKLIPNLESVLREQP